MNIAEFWNHIEEIKDSKLPAKDLVEILSKLSPEEVLSFKWHYEKVNKFAERFDLYYAAYMLIGWCEWEIFCDFRAAMIAKGKRVYESMLMNPDSLVEFWDGMDITDDAFSYVPVHVYELMTGQEIPQEVYDVPYEYIFEDGTVLATDQNWNFDDEVLNRNHLPKLSELYYSDSRITIQNEGQTVFTRSRYADDLSKKTYSVIEVKKKTH